MYDIEKNIRVMIVDIIKDYNEELIKRISKKFGLNETEMLNTYLIPHYYMPLIEREIKSLNI